MKRWELETAVLWASKLKVSTEALANSLRDAGLIDEDAQRRIKTVRVPASEKVDPELPSSLSSASRSRKEELLKRGLSAYYVSMCLQAYRNGLVTLGRVAEAMLVDETEVRLIAELYGERLFDGT